MARYGDEELVSAMAQMEQEDQIDQIPNDINNGYIVIEETRISFDEREIIDGKLYMTIPSDFELMPLELAKFKYPNENRPDIIFTNEEGSININFALTGDDLKNEEVEDAKNYLQEVMSKMNPSSKIISNSVIEEETRIGYFDFISPAIDGEIYNLMFLFSLDGEFVLGTFNCMDFDMAGWLEIAGQMIRSIRVIQGKK
jgi:hypothetical protein